jgi:hypothetical protein
MSSSDSTSQNSTENKYDTQTLQQSQGNILAKGNVQVTDQGAIAGGVNVAGKALDTASDSVKMVTNLAGDVVASNKSLASDTIFTSKELSNRFGDNTLTALGKVLDFTSKTQDYAQQNTQNLLNSATSGNANALNAVTEAKRSEASSAFTSLAKTLGLAVVGVIGVAAIYLISKSKGGA